MVSLSKGLGCPVGSCLAFAADRRAEAWEIRKRLGGGMRQSGILAAAGLYALDVNLPRIAEDHTHAKLFAAGVAGSKAVRAVPPDTNIVMLDLLRETDSADRSVAALAAAGVLCGAFGPRRLRFITHLDVTRADVERAAETVLRVLG
jgi:threonine aldolase